MKEITAFQSENGNLYGKASQALWADFQEFAETTVKTWAADMTAHYQPAHQSPLYENDERTHIYRFLLGVCKGYLSVNDVLSGILTGQKFFSQIKEEELAEKAATPPRDC